MVACHRPGTVDGRLLRSESPDGIGAQALSRTLLLVGALLGVGLGPAPDARAVTRVAAFGDSLTAGDPWVTALRDVYESQDLGLAGERTAEGVVRLESWIAGGTSSTDFVTLLEGTNDFFQSAYSEDETFSNLWRMVTDVEAAGMRPVLVAPPPILQSGREVQDARARALAARLAAAATAVGLRFVDLYASFRAQPDIAALYSADGLHPSSLGNAVIEAAMRRALDNCPTVDNDDQRDTDSDGIGDACQCGDVNGSGSVTAADAALILRSRAIPPTAVLARPELCDVGGAQGCTVADAAIVLRALLAPPRASIQQRCGADPE